MSKKYCGESDQQKEGRWQKTSNVKHKVDKQLLWVEDFCKVSQTQLKVFVSFNFSKEKKLFKSETDESNWNPLFSTYIFETDQDPS